MAALAADGQRHMIALGVVFADRRTGLHVVDDHTRIDDLHFGRHRRFGEDLIDLLLVADRHVEQHVAGMLLPDLRCALADGIRHAIDRGQRLPIDLDRLDGIACLLDRRGNDKGDGIADMAHFPRSKDRIVRAGEGMIFKIEQARQAAEILRVFRSQDGRNARHGARSTGIDGEGGMGMRRTQHERMERRWRVIVGIAATAPNQRIVFLAQDALSDTELDGSHVTSDCNLETVYTAEGERQVGGAAS